VCFFVCTEVFNAGEEAEAVEKHETILHFVEELIRNEPVDLDDLCVPIATSLLYMENRFNIPVIFFSNVHVFLTRL
jgi:hypothetical protein